MYKKALILNGNSNTGKTTTLYKLIELFPEKTVHEIYKRRLYKNVKRTVPEMSALIEYKGKNIWVITLGDDLGCVTKEIKKFIKKGYRIQDCDLFICASRNSGNLVKFILENFKIKKFIVKEDVASNREAFCEQKAKELKKEIDNFI